MQPQTLFPVLCQSCGQEIVIDIKDNTKQELSEHLKVCIPKIAYRALDTYSIEIPFSQITIGELAILRKAEIDYKRRIVIVRMIR